MFDFWAHSLLIAASIVREKNDRTFTNETKFIQVRNILAGSESLSKAVSSDWCLITRDPSWYYKGLRVFQTCKQRPLKRNKPN